MFMKFKYFLYKLFTGPHDDEFWKLHFPYWLTRTIIIMYTSVLWFVLVLKYMNIIKCFYSPGSLIWKHFLLVIYFLVVSLSGCHAFHFHIDDASDSKLLPSIKYKMLFGHNFTGFSSQHELLFFMVAPIPNLLQTISYCCELCLILLFFFKQFFFV